MLKNNGLFAKAGFLPAFLLAVLFCVSFSLALENGLARTPQMGWNPWNIFYGNIDEAKMLAVAHAMKNSGMLDAGYKYFNLDDCWMDPARDAQGKLQGHKTRFSHGMKWLGDSLHAMGFKFGLYGDRGTMT
jgi:alpha-galactosidase